MTHSNIVCRTDIADCVEDAFDGPPVSSVDLVQFAAEHGAGDPVLEALGRLHGEAYREIRDLWSELGDVPVER